MEWERGPNEKFNLLISENHLAGEREREKDPMEKCIPLPPTSLSVPVVKVPTC